MKKYQLLYADPPWDWITYSKKGAKKSPTSKYQCMTLKELTEWKYPSEISEDNSLIFMWATKPLLNKQIPIMEGWGFRYVTVGFTWVKLNKKKETPFKGCGYYTRANPEYCLIGRKGTPPRPIDRSIDEVVFSPIREHSQKPEIIYEYIQRMYPKLSKIELFARNERTGFDAFGNETDKYGGLTKFF